MREMAIPSLLPLSSVWWRYSFSQCLAHPSQYTALRALAAADFGRCPPPPVCITHLLPSLPYLPGYVDHLGGRALGSHCAQGLCTVKVRMIYSASIASEKKRWVRPENTMEFTLKSWDWVRNHEKQSTGKQASFLPNVGYGIVCFYLPVSWSGMCFFSSMKTEKFLII